MSFASTISDFDLNVDKRIKKLEDIKETKITGTYYDEVTNIYEEIIRKPNKDEIIAKINEIIDYINNCGERID